MNTVVKKLRNIEKTTLLDDLLPHFFRRDRFSSFNEEESSPGNAKKVLNIEFRSISENDISENPADFFVENC